MRSPSPSPSSTTRSRRRSPRGISLIEGLAAMGILVIGLLGTLQGITVAATQNATAGRMSRASSIAHEIRVGLEMRGRQAALSGPLSAANCNPAPAQPILDAGDAVAIAAGPAPTCITDLDVYETAAGPNAYVPGYTANERKYFRRILVFWRGTGLPGPSVVPDRIQVVVSFRGSGRTIFAKQFLAMYNPTLNQSGVEL